MKNVHDFQIKGSRLKCSVYRNKTKLMWIIRSKICEDSGHFRNKKKEFLEDKIDKIETNSKTKNIRDL